MEGFKVEGDVEGLIVGYGGNVDVWEFFIVYFGEKLFLGYGGLVVSGLI